MHVCTLGLSSWRSIFFLANCASFFLNCRGTGAISNHTVESNLYGLNLAHSKKYHHDFVEIQTNTGPLRWRFAMTSPALRPRLWKSVNTRAMGEYRHIWQVIWFVVNCGQMRHPFADSFLISKWPFEIGTTELCHMPMPSAISGTSFSDSPTPYHGFFNYFGT